MLSLSQQRDSKGRPVGSEGTKDGAHPSNALSTGCLRCGPTNRSSGQRGRTHLSLPGLWNSTASAGVIRLPQLTLPAAGRCGGGHQG